MSKTVLLRGKLPLSIQRLRRQVDIVLIPCQAHSAGNGNWDIDYGTEVRQRVSVSKTVADYALNIEIWSDMPEVLEETTARYGIRQYLYCDKCKKYDDAADFTFNYMDEKTEHHIIENPIYDIDSDYAMYYRIYNTISDKIASREQLYESQVKLYKQVKDKLSEIIDNFHFDICDGGDAGFLSIGLSLAL